MPDRARIHYNYGLFLQFLKRYKESETELKRALALDIINFYFIYALVDFYLKQNLLGKAMPYAELMFEKHPDQQVTIFKDLLKRILNRDNIVQGNR